MDIAVHVLSDIPASGNDGGVTWNFSPSIARRAVETHIRRIYAQANIRLGTLNVSAVQPVANLIAISHRTALEATGGGQILVEIESQRAGQTTEWSLNYTTQAGFTPLQTALEIVARINALDPLAPGTPGDFLMAEAFENPTLPTQSPNKHSADILIKDPANGKVTVVVAVTGDLTQDADAPPATADLIIGSQIGGSIQERALARNYAVGGRTLDVFVANDLTTEDGFEGPTGHAYALRVAKPVAERQREPLLTCCFVRRYTADDTNRGKSTIAHEIGHILLDATHVTAVGSGVPAVRQVMNDGGGADYNGTNGGRRIEDGPVIFDLIGGGTGGVLNQIERLRVSPLLY